MKKKQTKINKQEITIKTNKTKNNNKNNNSVTVPVKFYPNSEISKAQILSENQNKSGIYMWKNNLNDKQYIGSSIDL